MHGSSGKYWLVNARSSRKCCLFYVIKSIAFVDTSTDLPRKACEHGEAVRLTVADTSFRKFQLHLKAQTPSLATVPAAFLEVTG